MKKFFLSTTLLIVVITHAIGQTNSKKVDILWGPERKDSHKSVLNGVIGWDKNGIFTFNYSRDKLFSEISYSLEQFDKKLAFANANFLDTQHESEKLDVKLLININQKMYALLSFQNEELKTYTLFVQSIDKENLKFNDDRIKITEIDYSEKTLFSAERVNYEISRDSSKLLIYYDLPLKKNKGIGLHVINTNLKQIWEKKITFPYLKKQFEVRDYKVDNLGNVFLLGKISEGGVLAKQLSKKKQKFQLVSYLDKGNKVREYPLEIEGKFLTDIKIEINNENDIICAGFFSNKATFSAKGCYFLKIDGNTKEIKANTFEEFEIDFITQNLTKRQKKRKTKKKGEVELSAYVLDEIIIKKDGGAILIGEQIYAKANSSTVSSAATKVYYYNDIVVINISRNGEIIWNEKIAKRHRTTNPKDIYTSYAHTVMGDKLYFIFNGNSENLNYSGEGKVSSFTSGKNAIGMLVEVDSNGKQTTETLYTRDQSDGFLLRPKLCKQISDNEMILLLQKGNINISSKSRFVKMRIKE